MNGEMWPQLEKLRTDLQEYCGERAVEKTKQKNEKNERNTLWKACGTDQVTHSVCHLLCFNRKECRSVTNFDLANLFSHD